MSLQDQHQPMRILVIGAAARGNAYARAVTNCTDAVVHAVAEPLEQKRDALGKKYIWGDQTPPAGQSFEDWMAYLAYETQRRERKRISEDVEPGVDGVFICTADKSHAEMIMTFAPFNLHLITTLQDCLNIHRSLQRLISNQ